MGLHPCPVQNSVYQSSHCSALLIGCVTNFILQTAGIVSGLPYTFVVSILCIALWKAVKVSYGDLDPFGPKFTVGLFDCWGAQPMKTIMNDLQTGMND